MEKTDLCWQNLGGAYVPISKTHRFGTDAVLLESFASAKKGDRVCDFGSGCGIIPVLMHKNGRGGRIYAVELQSEAEMLICEAVAKNSCEGKIIPICCDIRQKEILNKEIGNNSLDLVVCNPPYFSKNSGGVYSERGREICREESMCDIYDVAEAARRLLKHLGRLCVCFKPERLCDCLDAMRKNGIEPKRLRFVCADYSDKPWLVLVEGKKGAAPFAEILPPLAMKSQQGFCELKEIYGSFMPDEYRK